MPYKIPSDHKLELYRNSAKWRNGNRISIREHDRELRHNGTLARLEAIQLLGGRCSRCGFSADIRGLCIDHINGGGVKERRKNGSKMYLLILSKIKAGSRDYQCLCATCNQIKRFENNE